jgi:TonB family protein
MGPVARFVFALMVASTAPCVLAQQQTLTESDTLACLTPAASQRGAPRYPEASFERREGGRFPVTLEFTAPDRAPKVNFSGTGGLSELSDAVLDFVRAYRVPCLKPGQVATLNQEFVFVPTDDRRVLWHAPVDDDDRRRERLANCVKHQSPGSKPNYPATVLNNGIEGTVVLKVSFAAGDMPPSVEVLDNAGSDRLAEAAKEFARGWRMPCHEGASVSVNQLYRFSIAGEPRMVLKDISLVTLISGFKGIRQANVYFDFNEMGCPFDLRFALYQPHSPNRVGEVGDALPARRFFLDWLRRQSLDLPAKQRNAIQGQITTVSVPCTVLRLVTTTGGGASQ